MAGWFLRGMSLSRKGVDEHFNPKDSVSHLRDGLGGLDPSQLHGKADHVDQESHLGREELEESVRSLKATWAGCDMLEAAKFQPVRWASLIVSTLAIIFSCCDYLYFCGERPSGGATSPCTGPPPCGRPLPQG